MDIDSSIRSAFNKALRNEEAKGHRNDDVDGWGLKLI